MHILTASASVGYRADNAWRNTLARRIRASAAFQNRLQSCFQEIYRRKPLILLSKKQRTNTGYTANTKKFAEKEM
jgi:hypothetical protein